MKLNSLDNFVMKTANVDQSHFTKILLIPGCIYIRFAHEAPLSQYR